MNLKHSLTKAENLLHTYNIKIVATSLLTILTSGPLVGVSKNTMPTQEEIITTLVPQEKDSMKTNSESREMVSDSVLFVNAVAKALKPLQTLTSMPEAGLTLAYDQQPKGNLPKTINIYPKKMNVDHLPYTLIQLGEKMFQVTPTLGFEVDDIYMDKEKFYVVVCQSTFLGDVAHITASKEKSGEMGDYLYRLYKKGAGEYKGSTVKEIPKAYQKAFLEAYNNLNK